MFLHAHRHTNTQTHKHTNTRLPADSDSVERDVKSVIVGHRHQSFPPSQPRRRVACTVPHAVHHVVHTPLTDSETQQTPPPPHPPTRAFLLSKLKVQ